MICHICVNSTRSWLLTCLKYKPKNWRICYGPSLSVIKHFITIMHYLCLKFDVLWIKFISKKILLWNWLFGSYQNFPIFDKWRSAMWNFLAKLKLHNWFFYTVIFIILKVKNVHVTWLWSHVVPWQTRTLSIS